MNIDAVLYRKLVSGNEYEPLFPQVNCDKSTLGSGNTFDTVKLIKQMVVKYKYQTTRISPLLAKSTLKETCDSVYGFLYNHIQYKADAREQYLRSPACAFKKRKEGVDCKSYSIFASCILSNLGIRHYIRQIKQPSFNPSLYTHVYIIVPLDQKTGDIKKGYYIIDGTTSTNREPIYTMAHDTEVNLPHYGLNAPKSRVRRAAKTAKKKMAVSQKIKKPTMTATKKATTKKKAITVKKTKPKAKVAKAKTTKAKAKPTPKNKTVSKTVAIAAVAAIAGFVLGKK